MEKTTPKKKDESPEANAPAGTAQPYADMNIALGKLLEFVAQVLSIIEANVNSLRHDTPPDPHALQDISWLSHSLYMTSRLGNSIKRRDTVRIERDCSSMLHKLRQYKKQDFSEWRPSPAGILDRYGKFLNPDHAIIAVKQIREAADALDRLPKKYENNA